MTHQNERIKGAYSTYLAIPDGAEGHKDSELPTQAEIGCKHAYHMPKRGGPNSGAEASGPPHQ